MNRLSERSKRILPQPMFEILAQAKALQESGSQVIRLEIGDTSEFVDEALRAHLIAEQFFPESLAYGDSAGEKELRLLYAQQESNLKNAKFGPENVAISPANAAITQLMQVMSDPGDALYLPDPCFPTYRLAANYSQLEIENFGRIEAGRFLIGLNELEEKFRADSRNKVLFLDSPSNPLGIAHEPRDVALLGELCAEYGVNLVIDQTYRNLIYEPRCDVDVFIEGATYIYSLSKDAGAPGLRMGFVLGPSDVIERVTAFNSMFFSCQPRFIQWAATKYLRERGHSTFGHIRRRYSSNQRLVASALSTSEMLEVIEPNSSMYLTVDIERLGIPSRQFCRNLLAAEKVSLCPGEGFGPSGQHLVRITVSSSPDVLVEATRRILNFVQSGQ